MTEKYCVSLDLAQRMKELGFKQESDFYWVDDGHGLGFRMKRHVMHFEGKIIASAHHVGELGEMIFNTDVSAMDTGIAKVRVENLEKFYCTLGIKSFYARTEADARAKMLIYLAENSLIDPTKV